MRHTSMIAHNTHVHTYIHMPSLFVRTIDPTRRVPSLEGLDDGCCFCACELVGLAFVCYVLWGICYGPLSTARDQIYWGFILLSCNFDLSLFCVQHNLLGWTGWRRAHNSPCGAWRGTLLLISRTYIYQLRGFAIFLFWIRCNCAGSIAKRGTY